MINYAHRGYSYRYPENTMLAFREAIRVGANGIELDVHKTKDNKLVVIHDEKVDRTYFGTGYVKDYTLEELRKLRNRDLLYTCSKYVYVPELEEVLDLIRNKNIILNIEIKNNKINYDCIEEDIIKTIKSYGMIKQVIISSFNHMSLLKCKKICKGIKVGLLYSKNKRSIIEYAKKYNIEALHPSVKIIDENYIKIAHKNGLEINPYTIDSKEEMEQLIKWEVDGIITNNPLILSKLLNKNK